MGTSAPAPKTKWKVTGHTETPDFDEHGKATTVHHVAFTSEPSGTESTVSVLDKHMSPHNVAAQINHKSAQIEAVHTLTSENQPTEPAE